MSFEPGLGADKVGDEATLPTVERATKAKRSTRQVTQIRKREVLKAVAAGASITSACQAVGISHTRWYRWKAADPAFAAEAERAMEAGRAANEVFITATSLDEAKRGTRDIDFVEFRRRYLDSQTFPHQLNLIDVMNGREPSWLHPAMTYERGEKNFVLVTVPPEHAKSMTLSIDYPTWRIATDPNSRGMIVSKTQVKAREFVYAVKQRLTNPRYRELQAAFGPPEGYERTADSWKADTIYLGAEVRDSSEKDPNLQALGMGGQVYGSRADYIIIDDAVTLANAHEYEKQIRWIQQEVLTRLGPNGVLLVVGTRVDNQDLYREIVDPDRYPSGNSPWTVLRMPAVLELADKPEDWVTLWPKSDQPWPGSDDEPDAEGHYPRWSGTYLSKRRGMLDAKTWAMVYQQADVSSDAVFPSAMVRACVNGMVKTGLLHPGHPHHPPTGAQLTIIAGLDPAIAGDMGIIVMAVDRNSRKRWVIDAVKVTSPSPAQIRDTIYALTDAYTITEWRMEKNSFQGYLTQDEDLRSQLASRGVIIREHYTGSNKYDVDYGVASMAGLLGTCDDKGKPAGDNLLQLPRTDTNEGVRALIEQLITWSPRTKNKTDMVMALWFAEIRAREIVSSASAYAGSHLPNRFLSPYARSQQITANLDELAASGHLRLVGG